MKKHLYILIPLTALVIFIGLQIYMIISMVNQKEEILEMRYKTLSREALTMLLSAKKVTGFEKAMDVTDKFAGIVLSEELPRLYTKADSVALQKEFLEKTYSIIEKSEKLSEFIRTYIGKAGYDTDFRTFVYIGKLNLITPDGKMVIYDTVPPPPSKTMIIVNSFMEEHNNFNIVYTLLIDLTHKNGMVFREALLSLVMILASILIVVLVYWLTWRNLREERRLSELKTDFINNMTHELKTPLSTITVASRTLEKDQVISEKQMVVDTARLIGKQSVHLNQLINTILEVSMLERTEFELDRHDVNPDELMHQIVSSFLTSCDGCARVEENYGSGIQAIRIDILYFTTMINNLLANAVKYCDQEPRITVTTGKTDSECVITVTDNGIGMTKEHLDHIFEKFYRVTQGNIHKTKGLGLGLYYVKRIANAHGGDVTVTSKPGRGSSFRITLPFKPE